MVWGVYWQQSILHLILHDVVWCSSVFYFSKIHILVLNKPKGTFIKAKILLLNDSTLSLLLSSLHALPVTLKIFPQQQFTHGMRKNIELLLTNLDLQVLCRKNIYTYQEVLFRGKGTSCPCYQLPHKYNSNGAPFPMVTTYRFELLQFLMSCQT